MKTNNVDRIAKIVHYSVITAIIACLVLMAVIFVAGTILEFMESGVNGKSITTVVISLGFVGIFVWGITYIIKWDKDAQQEKKGGR